ncbi:MAG: arginine--tRNA ligase [Patescibacteria group bacterium]
MRERIEAAIREALPGVNFVVERPATMAHGDYSTNAALVSKTDPHELAGKLKIDGVEKVEVVGRFINFFLSADALKPQEREVPQVYGGKTILVDYTQPNPFKPFHIGHLMSNAIGESLTRLFEKVGATVVRVNYQGDIGPHVAKALWGLMELKLDAGNIEDLGKAYVAGAAAYEDNPAAKTEIDGINQRLYKNDPALRSLYEEGKQTSLKHFDDIYRALGTKFDRLFFESETGPIGLQIVEAHKNLFEQSDGALVFKGEQYGTHTRVFITSKGTPTYETKELGLVELKQKEFPFDVAVTTTSGEQNGFFQVVEALVPLIWPTLKDRYIHVSHGMMKFASGKMASRKGNVITGESLLKDLTEAARGREDVAVGAIKYTVLKPGNGRDIIFDPEKSLSLEGDSGPYVQYALVRTRALLRKAADAEVGKSDFPRTTPLHRILIHYPDVVARAAKEMEPHHVVTYLTELAAAFNSWYAAERLIIDGKVSSGNLELVQAVEKTLAHGLHVLGIPTPEEM